MPFTRRVMRYAHSEGHTAVCYSSDGSNIITCGSDGDVRTWTSLEDDDPTSQFVGEWALQVGHKDERLFVATDRNTVQAYTFPAFDREGMIVRFSAPISHFAIQKDMMIAGSQDTEVRVLSISRSEGSPQVLLQGHEGPVLGVALCPKTRLCASSSGDGTLRIWVLEDKSLAKQYDCVPKINSFASAKVLGRPSFEPTGGKYLAYPNNTEIIVVETINWQQKFSFSNPKVKSAYSICDFSPCGLYIAASSISGDICVWELASQRCVVMSEHPNGHNVCGLAWNPTNNGELAYTDVTGQLGTVEDCYSTDDIISNIEDEHRLADDVGNLDDDMDLHINEDEDSDGENTFSLEKIKNATLKHGLPIDAGESRPQSSASSTKAVATPVSYLQPPFQPSSTPATLEHRYLTWNHVGIVRSHTSDTENSIEVEFHDSTTHHGIHMNNYLNHTMASLSSTVLALASETPSKLVCIALGASGSKEWSAELPQGEEILAVGAADKLVAVATDARMLRLFSVLGTQREVLSIPGPVISIAGFADKLLVAYHNGSGIAEDQNISVMFIHAMGFKVRCSQFRLPLSPGSRLTWLGFTDCGSPVSFDSSGMLRIYMTRGGVWLPLCDASTHVKGVSDKFFVVEVSESTQVMRAVLCRGIPFPPTTPRPAVSELPLQLPMCELDTDKTQMEERLCRWSHCQVDQPDKVFKETAIKLFALACRSELEQRAQELIELFASPQLLSLAIKYASKLGRMHLADKLSALAGVMEDQADLTTVNSEECAIVSVDTSMMTHNSTSLLMDKGKVTPVLAPLSMKTLTQKRNPFKRSLTGGTRSPNPLSHLTDRAVGFASPDSQGTSQDTQESVTDTPKASKTSQRCIEINETFMEWYAHEKVALQTENPDMTPSDLTKFAMKQYKQGQVTNKRKLSDDLENQNTNTKQSKLSAFAFSRE